MEKEDSVIKECRVHEVAGQLYRYQAPDGRKWPAYRVGRYYVKDNREWFTTNLRLDDIPLAEEQLHQVYLWAKENPQAVKNGAEE